MSQQERQGTATQRPETRRRLMTVIGKAALAAPPAVTMIMAAASKPARATPPYWAPAHGWRRKNRELIGFSGSRGNE